jgi:hypothetical protein
MEFRKQPFKSYTQPGRLQDVLALIQVLGLDENAHRSEDGLRSELQGVPRSASSWTELAQAHPEFFRVRPEGEHNISLVSRHVTSRLKTKKTSANFLRSLLANFCKPQLICTIVRFVAMNVGPTGCQF